MKRTGKAGKKHPVLCGLAAWFIRLCWATGHWRTLGAWRPKSLWQANQPFILCFWHGRLAMMPQCWPRHIPIHMLISGHNDGRLIADTVRHFGINSVQGSTNKDGHMALRRMIRLLRAGHCVGITPDGPRGPRMRASIGAISLARLSGMPLIPATYSLSRGKHLGSWDRFLIPYPFAAGFIVWGTPIRVPKDADETLCRRYTRTLETELNKITARADYLAKRPAIAPARRGGTPTE